MERSVFLKYRQNVFSLNPTFVETEISDSRNLLDQARAGDAEAFGEICRLHGTRLLRQAFVLCGDVTLAEDLAQDTLVEACKCLHRFHGRCQFFTWLCAILLNRYHNVRRKHWLWPATASGGREPDELEPPALADHAAQPDQAAEQREQAALVRRCLQTLPGQTPASDLPAFLCGRFVGRHRRRLGLLGGHGQIAFISCLEQTAENGCVRRGPIGFQNERRHIMKPCHQNRKLIAWLAANALDARQTRQLRLHLETCEGCRQYLAEISNVTEKLVTAEVNPNLQVSERFHRQVAQKIRSAKPESLVETLAAYFHEKELPWRVVLPTVAALVLVIGFSVVTWPRPTKNILPPPASQRAVTTSDADEEARADPCQLPTSGQPVLGSSGCLADSTKQTRAAGVTDLHGFNPFARDRGVLIL